MLPILLMALESASERRKITEIYEQCKDKLFFVALGVTKNNQMAEDAVHNTFEKIIRNKEKVFALSTDEFLRIYITAVKNEAIDLMRRERKLYSKKTLDDLEDELNSGELPPDLQAVQNADYEAMKRHIRGLDEELKSILIMKYDLGQSYREIGEELGLTPKVVDNKLTSAKKKVRIGMMEEGYGSVE